MDLLKKFWPTPFKIKEKDLTSFLIQLIIFIVIVAVVGFLIGILSALPIIGIIFSIVGSLIGVYNIVGIVLCVLKFLGIVKSDCKRRASVRKILCGRSFLLCLQIG